MRKDAEMKIIYIAGRYRDKRGEWYVVQNIRKAEEAALFVWRNGGVALCPHKNAALFGGATPDDIWLAGDLELLKRCDAIWLTDGWEGSDGARREFDFAFANDIPRLYDCEEVKRFLDGSTKHHPVYIIDPY